MANTKKITQGFLRCFAAKVGGHGKEGGFKKNRKHPPPTRLVHPPAPLVGSDLLPVGGLEGGGKVDMSSCGPTP